MKPKPNPPRAPSLAPQASPSVAELIDRSCQTIDPYLPVHHKEFIKCSTAVKLLADHSHVPFAPIPLPSRLLPPLP